MRDSALSTGPAYGGKPFSGLLASAIFAAIAFWGCSTQGPSNLTPAYTPVPTPSAQATSPPAPTSTALTAPAIRSTEIPRLIGSPAPDFTFSLFQGEDILGEDVFRLAQLEGRPLVLNFWARFCGPCWTEMPDLQAFYEEYGDRLQLLGIDLGQFTGLGSPKDAGKLLEALGITYPAGFTDDAHVVRSYRVAAMPTTVFVDAEGVVVRTWSGAIRRDQLETIVADILPEE